MLEHSTLLGTSPAVFLGVTVILAGWTGFMTGQAIARTWRPVWQVVFYCALLAAAGRFLIYGLFDGELLSWKGYLCDAAAVIVIGLISFQASKAQKMVNQYPWKLRRVGLFGWREIG